MCALFPEFNKAAPDGSPGLVFIDGRKRRLVDSPFYIFLKIKFSFLKFNKADKAAAQSAYQKPGRTHQKGRLVKFRTRREQGGRAGPQRGQIRRHGIMRRRHNGTVSNRKPFGTETPQHTRQSRTLPIEKSERSSQTKQTDFCLTSAPSMLECEFKNLDPPEPRLRQ